MPPQVGSLPIVAIVGSVIWLSAPADNDHAQHGDNKSRIAVPTLSSAAKQGEVLFNANCVACHGKNGSGTQNGPPLVHKIYEPGHHADESFLLAVSRGVRSHHWQFGDMPPRDDVSSAEARVIVSYVRALQRANGID